MEAGSIADRKGGAEDDSSNGGSRRTEEQDAKISRNGDGAGGVKKQTRATTRGRRASVVFNVIFYATRSYLVAVWLRGIPVLHLQSHVSTVSLLWLL